MVNISFYTQGMNKLSKPVKSFWEEKKKKKKILLRYMYNFVINRHGHNGGRGELTIYSICPLLIVAV